MIFPPSAARTYLMKKLNVPYEEINVVITSTNPWRFHARIKNKQYILAAELKCEMQSFGGLENNETWEFTIIEEK